MFITARNAPDNARKGRTSTVRPPTNVLIKSEIADSTAALSLQYPGAPGKRDAAQEAASAGIRSDAGTVKRRIIVAPVSYGSSWTAVTIAPAAPLDDTRCEETFTDWREAALFAYHVRRARGWPVDDRTPAAIEGRREAERERATAGRNA